MSDPLPRLLDRRDALKWMMAAGAAALLVGRPPLGAASQAAAPLGPRDGYGTDPDMIRRHVAGDFWPLTFTPAQRALAAALCDVIVPADSVSPAASALGVHDFLDEWVSAPYPDQAADRAVILGGLARVDAESGRLYGCPFASASPAQQVELCTTLAAPPAEAAPGEAHVFFKRMRDLVAAGFFSTPTGMRDLGYVGNTPLARFEGPPADLVDRLGLSGEVQW